MTSGSGSTRARHWKLRLGSGSKILGLIPPLIRLLGCLSGTGWSRPGASLWSSTTWSGWRRRRCGCRERTSSLTSSTTEGRVGINFERNKNLSMSSFWNIIAYLSIVMATVSLFQAFLKLCLTKNRLDYFKFAQSGLSKVEGFNCSY